MLSLYRLDRHRFFGIERRTWSLCLYKNIGVYNDIV